MYATRHTGYGDDRVVVVRSRPAFRHWPQHLVRGLSIKEIAATFSVSRTVADHLGAIFEKFGVQTRGELVSRPFFDHYYARVFRGDSLWGGRISNRPVPPAEECPAGKAVPPVAR
jgi:Bacterial regulatory proteins, luxR family